MQKLDSECSYLEFINTNRICAISELGTLYIYDTATADLNLEHKLITIARVPKRDSITTNGHILLTSKLRDNTIIFGNFLI